MKAATFSEVHAKYLQFHPQGKRAEHLQFIADLTFDSARAISIQKLVQRIVGAMGHGAQAKGDKGLFEALYFAANPELAKAREEEERLELEEELRAELA